MNNRINGYYFVKHHGQWYVGYWDSKIMGWDIRGYGIMFDSDFEDINENQILPPNE